MGDPVSRDRAHSADPPAREPDDARSARVRALRRAYLNGTLAPTFSPESRGLDRLIEDLLGGRRRR